VDLAPHLILGLAVASGCVAFVTTNDIIQSVLECVETRKCRHGGIEMNSVCIAEGMGVDISKLSFGAGAIASACQEVVRCGSPRGEDIKSPPPWPGIASLEKFWAGSYPRPADASPIG